MTRILSYNILVGGTRRVDQIARMISSARPDVVGLVEANDSKVVAELAKRLNMQSAITGSGKYSADWNIALLSRLPIIETKIHKSSHSITKPALEVRMEEPDGQRFTAFVTHLSAAFSHKRAGDVIRRREIQDVLRIMSSKQGTPHVWMGDFNAIAPGDRMKGSMLLRYVLEKDHLYHEHPLTISGHPYLNFVVPPHLRPFNPILRAIPRSKLLCAIFDEAGSLYAPRKSISVIRNAGYVDCFRYIHPRQWGFTCPASSPAGRIDYIFASPEMARSLSACDVVTEGEGISGEEASDHLPVVAEFGQPVGDAIAQSTNPRIEIAKK